jgi:ABC-type Fe3+ transport system substrate-binding protein
VAARGVIGVAALLLMLPVSACTREVPPLRVALGVPELLARSFLNEFGTAEGVAVTIESATVRGACADCDVVWSADLSSALALPLTALPAGNYGRPSSMVGAEHRWVAASAVARVIIFDPNQVSDDAAPTRITELARQDIASRLVLADPRRGDAAWQAAALFGALGEHRALELYRGLVAHGALIAADEDAVIAALLDGTRQMALTNSDRAFAAQGKERTLVISVVDQDEGGVGAFLSPAVAGITERGAAHPSSRALVEFLLSPPVTRRIALTADAILVLDDPAETPAGLLSISKLKVMPVSYGQLAAQLAAVRAALDGVIQTP